MATLLLRKGLVIDGTRSPAFRGSVLIDGDRIKAMIPEGQGLPAADQVIDADGCVISPGFSGSFTGTFR